VLEEVFCEEADWEVGEAIDFWEEGEEVVLWEEGEDGFAACEEECVACVCEGDEPVAGLVASDFEFGPSLCFRAFASAFS
jgi:hypothetical protein